MSDFIRKLQTESRLYFFGRSLFCAVLGFSGWAGLLVLLDLYDVFSPIRENDAMSWLIGAALIGGLVFITLMFREWLNRPCLRKVAEKVEVGNPHLKDALNTAVEIHQTGKFSDLMQKRVLSEVNRKSNSIRWELGVRPGQRFWNLLLAGFLAGLLLSIWNLNRSPILKAKAALSEVPGIILHTAPTGAVDGLLSGPDSEFRKGLDISLFADITRSHRGEKKAWVEIAGSSTFKMVPTAIPSRQEFIIPALQVPVQYRVLTPSLETSWHQISPYDPPTLEFAHWAIQPPAYLKMPEINHNGFGYLEVPEGSRISVDVRVLDKPKNIEAMLQSSDGNHSLDAVGQVTFNRKFTLDKEWSGKLVLRDLDEPDRPPVIHDPMILSPLPDEPPVVEISSPAQDLELPFDAEPLLIDLFAADDHGISDLRLHISHDGIKKEDLLFVDPVEKEKSVTGILDLSEYPLAVGDLLTYIAFAVDNREPEGQIARSEVYFIEILPPEGNTTESEEQAGGMEGESKEIPIRQFINRTKQIFRDTYDAMMEEGTERQNQSLAICADSLDLKHEMTKTYDEFAGRFPISNGIDLGELLNEATYHIEQTEIYTGDYLLEESIESTEQTLRKLVQLYALMQEMEKQKAKGQGQSTEGKPESGQTQENNQTVENTEDPSKKLEELASQLDLLRDLQSRQDSLNEQMGQASGRGQKGQANQDLASNQENIRQELQQLRDRRYDQTGKLGDVSELEQAGREMKEGAADLRRDQPRQAHPHGELAADVLGQAVSRIEREMAQLSAKMVDQLTQRANQLEQGQGNLRQKTNHAGGGQGEKLRQEQDSLNGGMEQLLDKIDQTARSLGKHNEEAMEQLLKSLREARENGMERSGKQASNALLYDAFPQASSQQEKIEKGLGELGDKLQGVEDKLLHGNSAELAELAEHLQSMRQETSGMGEEIFRQMNEEAARLLGNLADSDSDERLLNLTRMFEESAITEDSLSGRSISAGAVEKASQLVEQFLWHQAVEEKLLRNHHSTRAPVQYRKQVEKYFRRIAEGQ